MDGVMDFYSWRFCAARGVAGRLVGELDVVDVDVAPAGRLSVHDLDDRLLPVQVAHVPEVPFQRLVILAGRRAHDLAADN